MEIAENQYIILLDGDLEIEINCINDVIKKHKKYKESVIIGNRWNSNNKKNVNLHSFGNKIINFLFNLLYKTNYKDILCCLKLIDKNLFHYLDIKSSRFSIEAELMAKLSLIKSDIKEINVNYKRRTIEQGKKLKPVDGFSIIKEIFYTKYKNKLK